MKQFWFDWLHSFCFLLILHHSLSKLSILPLNICCTKKFAVLLSRMPRHCFDFMFHFSSCFKSCCHCVSSWGFNSIFFNCEVIHMLFSRLFHLRKPFYSFFLVHFIVYLSVLSLFLYAWELRGNRNNFIQTFHLLS